MFAAKMQPPKSESKNRVAAFFLYFSHVFSALSVFFNISKTVKNHIYK
jgi:hypothetical protein